MDWKLAGRNAAAKNCTIIAMRERAKWHRLQAKEFLSNSCHSMGQHERDAEALEAAATKLEQLEIARAGVEAGEFKAILQGYSLKRGSYIEVQADEGWMPFWCEERQLKVACAISA